ncbi:MAG: single-stranded-DNA-specific exonuclease RecJ [Candidatus Pacebacteria bacterium]|jgi:single-stranded-DNA-specific exonuclease|nr:single-stranded-DNA-specific exonuclease RecJ [Candidatus Paceibacterota bacterium]
MTTDNELAGYPELVQTLLQNRGITTREAAEQFLTPSYERDLHDPLLMKDMEKSIVRIFAATQANEKILIYGDYDCDGIPGSVILHDLFKKIKYENFAVYIPDRHEEGYGLNMEAIKEAIEGDVKLIITVDLGTTDVDEVAEAQANGIDVIITDHHLPHGNVPHAYALVNPKREDDHYPYDMLCGAGVAWKLASAFAKKYGEFFTIKDGEEKWWLDMAAIGTLSDMVPLQGENRAIAYFGMKVLKKNRRAGLRKLFAKAKVDAERLVEEDITFTIAPRLNAASRMDSPRKAFELLAAEKEDEAGALADHLVKINDERKYLVATIIKETKKKLKEREAQSVIVIGSPVWRVGILGLVAGKLADEHKKPVFVWGLEGSDTIKGSCRSGDGSNLVELMTAAGEGTFLDFGGHAGAGGFSVSHESVHFLEERLSVAHATLEKKPVAVVEGGTYEAILSLADVTAQTYKRVEPFAPFGIGNPKPVFLFHSAEISYVKKFGKQEEHLEIGFVKPDGSVVKAISFFTEPERFSVSLKEGSKVELLATIESSTFLRKSEIRLRIVDITQ